LEEMPAVRIVKAIVLALLLALLLAVVGSIVAGVGQENALFAVFFWVGLISFFVLFLKVQRVGFWFCLSYAIGWALLPISAAINTAQPAKETGCAGVAAAIGAALLLFITIPVGAVGFILFLLLALLVFRKKKPPAAKPTTEGPGQP
jgi:hypothetical protein